MTDRSADGDEAVSLKEEASSSSSSSSFTVAFVSSCHCDIKIEKKGTCVTVGRSLLAAFALLISADCHMVCPAEAYPLHRFLFYSPDRWTVITSSFFLLFQ